GYMNDKISWKIVIEILLCLYFAFGLASAFYLKDFGLFIFHAMLFAGFSFIVYYTFKTRAA
ncbi:MAG: glycosyl transferase family 2, partial [Bacteroidota bacterium]